jgi:hypothetical protein
MKSRGENIAVLVLIMEYLLWKCPCHVRMPPIMPTPWPMPGKKKGIVKETTEVNARK